MCIPLLLLFACTGSESSQFVGEAPVGDAILADTHGTATPRFWLAGVVREQGAVQAQQIGETMRLGNDNWFADSNLQLIANAALAN